MGTCSGQETLQVGAFDDGDKPIEPVIGTLGDYEGAKKLLTNSLASVEQHYEPEYPSIAIFRSNFKEPQNYEQSKQKDVPQVYFGTLSSPTNSN